VLGLDFSYREDENNEQNESPSRLRRQPPLGKGAFMHCGFLMTDGILLVYFILCTIWYNEVRERHERIKYDKYYCKYE
jgi:hypothetical protein